MHDKSPRSRSDRFVILDRDGTLIVDRRHLGDPAGVELLPNAVAGLRLLRSLELKMIVVTNQSGVGRGYFDLTAVTAVNARLQELLACHGVALDDLFVCPHAPEAGCGCRKPRRGLVDDAARKWGFMAAECIVIGDQPCDIALGRAIGARTIRIAPVEPTSEVGVEPDAHARDLLDAAGVVDRWLTQDRAASDRS